jgi:hypothetical protein
VIAGQDEAGRHQDGADQQGVDQKSDDDGDADLGDQDRRQDGENQEGAGHDQPGGGDDAAGDGEAAHGAVPDAVPPGFLADAGGQEDVVVHPQGDQEDEDVQRQLRFGALEAEAAPGQAGQAEGGAEAESGGHDQDQGRDDGPQQQRDDDQDDQQHQRDQQQGVAVRGLGDVVLDGRAAADQGTRCGPGQVLAQGPDRVAPGGAVRRDGQDDRPGVIARDRGA